MNNTRIATTADDFFNAPAEPIHLTNPDHRDSAISQIGLQGPRAGDAFIRIPPPRWRMMRHEDSEYFVPEPLRPNVEPDEHSIGPCGRPHYMVYRPDGYPTVRLYLYFYNCNVCVANSGVHTGKLTSRGPDLKLGGVCGDVPSAQVAHIVSTISKLPIAAIDVFRNNYGRCNLWLEDASLATEMIRRIDRRFWMAPVCHGYAVVVNDDYSREYLLAYIESLKLTKAEQLALEDQMRAQRRGATGSVGEMPGAPNDDGGDNNGNGNGGSGDDGADDDGVLPRRRKQLKAGGGAAAAAAGANKRERRGPNNVCFPRHLATAEEWSDLPPAKIAGTTAHAKAEKKAQQREREARKRDADHSQKREVDLEQRRFAAVEAARAFALQTMRPELQALAAVGWNPGSSAVAAAALAAAAQQQQQQHPGMHGAPSSATSSTSSSAAATQPSSFVEVLQQQQAAAAAATIAAAQQQAILTQMLMLSGAQQHGGGDAASAAVNATAALMALQQQQQQLAALAALTSAGGAGAAGAGLPFAAPIGNVPLFNFQQQNQQQQQLQMLLHQQHQQQHNAAPSAARTFSHLAPSPMSFTVGTGGVAATLPSSAAGGAGGPQWAPATGAPPPSRKQHDRENFQLRKSARGKHGGGDGGGGGGASSGSSRNGGIAMTSDPLAFHVSTATP